MLVILLIGGWQVSEFASTTLLPLLFNNIAPISETDEVALDREIVRTFASVEKQYVDHVRPSFKLGFGEVRIIQHCYYYHHHVYKIVII